MSQYEDVTISMEAALLQRVDELIDQLQLSREEFFTSAIQNELTWQETQSLKAEISNQEIMKTLLDSGQTVGAILPEERPPASGDIHHCELCLREFRKVLGTIEGPVFCDDCLAVARGGSFDALLTRS